VPAARLQLEVALHWQINLNRTQRLLVANSKMFACVSLSYYM